MFNARWCAGVLVVILALPAAAAAQVTTADIVGRVTDSSGAVLPGATVTIENLATHDVRTAPTNETGDYLFNLLPIGTYTVNVELQGFASQTTRVVLSAGDRVRFDPKLQLGQVQESVLVTAESPLLQTDTATVSALVSEKAVQDLPVSGRNVVRLVQLVPGAFEGLTNSLATGNRPDDRRQTSAVSINGAMDNQNNHLIDGIDNNERSIGTVGVKPSIDAIAEVKVQTSMYTAEVGRTFGGVVNIITKSGGNAFHGSGFEFFRNDRFDARNFFATSIPKPKLSQNQYGGSLGGPLIRNKTFFFADFERFDVTQGVTAVVTVPTAKMRAGDFSELSTVIYDPTTTPRTPFAGNIISSGRLEPVALKYLSLYPLPTSAGLANNYTGVRDRTQVNSTTSYNTGDTFTPPVFPIVNGIEGGGGGSFPGKNDTAAHNFGASYSKVFSPSLVGEFRTGYLNVNIASYGLNYGSNVAASFGLPGVNIDDLTSGLTPITLTGYAGAGDATFLPLIQVNHTWQGSGSLTKIKGPHSIKGGAGLINRNFSLYQSNSPLGTITFNTTLTDNGAGSGGNTIASFVLGYPQQVTRIVSLFYPHYNTKEPFAFVQDDWRATSNLTLNLGLRYDVFTPYTEQDNHLVNVDIARSAILVAGQNSVSRTAGIQTDYSNLAPRLGFSATLPALTVVRGGYGLSFYPGNYMSQSFLKSAPFTSTYGPVISNAASGGVPNLFLRNGLPLPAATDITVPSGTFQAEELNFRNTRTHQYNLFVEKEMSGNVVGAGYLGWKADHLTQYIGNVDLAPAGPGAIQPRRAFAATLPNVSAIPLVASDFEGTYNAMQVTFQRRQQSGLTLSSSYTLAHAVQTNASPWDVTVIERYDSDFDVRHRFVLSANYELPFLRTASGPVHAVFAGWQVNGVAVLQSGIPFTVANGTARSNTGGTDRPNQLGNPQLDNPTVAQWFDVTAFAAEPINTAGNTGRNTLHGPPMRRLDLSLFKNVDLTASTRLQLRAEVFNVTNTPSFSNPNANFGTAGFGSITSTGNNIPRQMQFAVKVLF
ncbi:MAG: TonB-dependent receptor [Acidobacteria bacterium]|nr:MAG: TonB-dependent receptor [Acidobacteriota bacterium]